MATFAIECLEYGSIAPADARALSELAIATWPPSDAATAPRAIEDGAAALLRPAPYDGPAAHRPRIFCLRHDQGRIVSQARVFPRAILTKRGPLTVMGLGGVCTARSARGHGLGMILMREVFRLVDSGVFACSLFQTRVPSFYERLGARVVTNRFINTLAVDPNARPFWDPVTMVYPATYDWPEGTVDLQGPGY